MDIIFTVCNRTQIHHALCLAESVRSAGSDQKFLLGWVDPAPITNLPNWIEIIQIDSLQISEWQEMTSRYFDFELVAATKPFFARHILKNFADCRELIYLSPTTLVFEPLNGLMSADKLLWVTPNRLSPLDPQSTLADRHILNSGMFHSGSWVLHPDGSNAFKLLDWWCRRTTNRAHFDLCSGMCLDQLWLNYLPIYFNQVETIRNEGWHYGLHRISGTKFSKSGDKYLVNDTPLVSLEMAGLEDYHPVWSDHGNLIDGHPLWHEIRSTYRMNLKRMKLDILSSEASYGKSTDIKSSRLQRKKAIRFLNLLIHRIETLNLTYN